MNIKILVVDDNTAIREGFKSKFLRYADEQLAVNADVESLGTSDDAVQRISDTSKPQFDLLFTDIDLSSDGNPNHAGIAFAQYAKRLLPDVPVIGYSGYFDQGDLTEKDLIHFDRWWSKSGSIDRLNEIVFDALKRAIERKTRRTEQNKIFHTMTSSNDDKPLHTPTTDVEFSQAGYKKHVIEPSKQHGLIEPFAVWAKTSDEGVELEVVGCSALFAWGDDFSDAETSLIELIEDYRSLLNDHDDSFSPSMLNAKRFIQSVTGSRTGGDH